MFHMQLIQLFSIYALFSCEAVCQQKFVGRCVFMAVQHEYSFRGPGWGLL